MQTRLQEPSVSIKLPTLSLRIHRIQRTDGNVPSNVLSQGYESCTHCVCCSFWDGQVIHTKPTESCSTIIYLQLPPCLSPVLFLCSNDGCRTNVYPNHSNFLKNLSIHTRITCYNKFSKSIRNFYRSLFRQSKILRVNIWLSIILDITEVWKENRNFEFYTPSIDNMNHTCNLFNLLVPFTV